jgi:hypothetical protein
MGYAKLTLKVNLHLVTVQQPNSFPKLCIEDGEYNDEQLYNSDKTGLHYKVLPNKALGLTKQL